MKLFNRNNKFVTPEWRKTILELEIHRFLTMDAYHIAGLITDDPNELNERSLIFQDLAASAEVVAVIEKIREAIRTITHINEKSKLFADSIERLLYDFSIINVYSDIIIEIAKSYEIFRDDLKSQRLLLIFSNFYEFYNSDKFEKLQTVIADILHSAKHIRSFTVGINLNANLEPSEIGLISINEHHFTQKNVYTKFFKTNDIHFEYAAPIIEYNDTSALLERSLYTSANNYIIKALKRTQIKLIEEVKSMFGDIFASKEDITFLLKALSYKKSCRDKFCFPVIANETRIIGAYSPTLLFKVKHRDVVSNNIHFDEKGNVFIITGANAGGKSVYVRTIGVVQILFQLGLPIPAESAQMKIVNNIFTHFATSIDTSDSRFVLECKAMQKILDAIDSDSLLLMDESFSSTSSYEGAAVAEQVIERLQSIGCMCVYSTHLHELTALADSEQKYSSKIENLHIQMKDGVPTYHIIEGTTHGKSYAYDIAKKYGLEFKK